MNSPAVSLSVQHKRTVVFLVGDNPEHVLIEETPHDAAGQSSGLEAPGPHLRPPWCCRVVERSRPRPTRPSRGRACRRCSVSPLHQGSDNRDAYCPHRSLSCRSLGEDRACPRGPTSFRTPPIDVHVHGKESAPLAHGAAGLASGCGFHQAFIRLASVVPSRYRG
jgi:hypothetical protein